MIVNHIQTLVRNKTIQADVKEDEPKPNDGLNNNP